MKKLFLLLVLGMFVAAGANAQTSGRTAKKSSNKEVSAVPQAAIDAQIRELEAKHRSGVITNAQFDTQLKLIKAQPVLPADKAVQSGSKGKHTPGATGSVPAERKRALITSYESGDISKEEFEKQLKALSAETAE